jgi:hypothetical protein
MTTMAMTTDRGIDGQGEGRDEDASGESNDG